MAIEENDAQIFAVEPNQYTANDYLDAASDIATSIAVKLGSGNLARDPEVYHGTSGIALFLARTAKATGDVNLRDRALFGAQMALDQYQRISPSHYFGLYVGLLGMASAIAEIGEILNSEELIRQARLLADKCLPVQETGEFDLVGGKAGGILALLSMSRIFASMDLTGRASELGDQLIEQAEKNQGYSWRSPNISATQNLTGFAHGTAGVGYAFLALYKVTNDTRYLTAAEMCFEYENSCFDGGASNWCDFRLRPGRPCRNFATSWCHGAPGISLSRVLAYRITGKHRYREDLAVALQTTQQATAKYLFTRGTDFCLCHGMAGNAAILLVSGLKSPWASVIADSGIQMYRSGGWPCRAQGTDALSLMVGLSGIGYFYLQMSDPFADFILAPMHKALLVS